MSRQDENEIQFVILLKQDDTIIIHSRASLSYTRDKFWPILWTEIGKVIKMSDENFAILNQEKIRDSENANFCLFLVLKHAYVI